MLQKSLLNYDNCSEPTSKMLRISSVWRIRQIKFQISLRNASISRLTYKILLGSEQLQIKKNIT